MALPPETVALLDRIHDVSWAFRWFDYDNAVHVRIERGEIGLGFNTVVERQGNESKKDVLARVEATKPELRKQVGLNY